MTRNALICFLIILILPCCPDLSKKNITKNTPEVFSLADVSTEKDLKEVKIQEEIINLPIINECPNRNECPENSICDQKENIKIPEIESLCTKSCDSVNLCSDLPTANCCTAMAQENSYFLIGNWCVPEKFCCNVGEKLCGENCCPEKWYCGVNGECLPQCQKDEDCKDENICTLDECIQGVCVYSDISASSQSPYGCCLNDGQCVDNNFCTIDVCQNNWCEHLKNPKCECQPMEGISDECDDENIQTEDYCSSGICMHINIPGACESDQECDDGIAATKIFCENNQCKLNCIYNCVEKECEDDGCGKDCGKCKVGTFCNGWQQCQCDANYWCNGKECGINNCGGICGVCPGGYKCNNGIGKCECIPKCENRECGSDECGGSCGTCPPDYICDTSLGKCLLQNPCKNVECGWIGEGETAKYCGDCEKGEICKTGKCKMPELVCDEENSYENYLCSGDKCDSDNIQSSQPLQPSSYGAYLQPGSWVEIKVPGIWKDADILKIEFKGNKISLKFIDEIIYDIIAMNGNVKEISIMSKNIFQDGEVELFFEVVGSSGLCGAENGYFCQCNDCDCLSGKCLSAANPGASSYDEKCEKCLPLFSPYCQKCPYLSYVKVTSCYYD